MFCFILGFGWLAGWFFCDAITDFVDSIVLKENYSRENSVIILSLLWPLSSVQSIHSLCFFQSSFCLLVCLGFFAYFVIDFASGLWVTHKPIPPTYASSC